PGAFVRAIQDLDQASFDRARLEKYLDAVRGQGPSADDPAQLHQRTLLLARSLSIRVQQECFDKPSEQQLPCLTQNTDQLVLDDAHSQSMTATLTTGAPVDLLSQLSSTPTARSGYYSPYIGAVVDVARILATTHTAQYQYIPALALPKDRELNLKLNNPPSFRNPKSVLVVGLPPIAPAVLPVLRSVDSKQIACIANPSLLLPVEGAPLVFATELARHLTLHIPTKSGKSVDLPAQADSLRGGISVDTSGVNLSRLDSEMTGTIRGFWGFQSFEGPRFSLHAPRSAKWIVASKDASALIVGREDTLHLQSADASCVNDVSIKDHAGKNIQTSWKMLKPDQLEVKVSLQDVTAGPVNMSVKKFGLHEADEIALQAYSEASRLDGFSIHAGDAEGILKGTRLDEVSGLEFGNLKFSPLNLSRENQRDELTMSAAEKANLKPDFAGVAHVSLKDGRILDVNVNVEAPRPEVSLISKSEQLDPNSAPQIVHLGSPDEVPQDAKLNFFLKTEVPEAFPPGEKIEVATSDASFHVLLSMADGNLTFQDSRTVLAVLDPMKHLGPSAFGALKFRPVSADGTAGDWLPLATLVRIPILREIQCSSSPQNQCALSGDKLFLLDSVSNAADFANPVEVPDGFANSVLTIPWTKTKTLYLKLRDDPATIDTVDLPVVTAMQ
ncbi:MAG: hypothetical protein ACRD2U_12075, partial [Terriglobales bacterium]